MAHHSACNSKKESFWRSMIQGQAESGMSIRAWCQEHRLSESGFYHWRQVLAPGGPKRKPTERRDMKLKQSVRRGEQRTQLNLPMASSAFMPVHVAQDATASNSGRIEIFMANGQRIHIIGSVDRQALVDVLDLLRSTGSSEVKARAC